MRRNNPLSNLHSAGTWLISACLFFLIGACGGPAPGEGMDHPMAEKTLPKIVSTAEALTTPDIPKIDPGTLDEAEIKEVIPSGPRCDFAYTAASPSILAASINTSTPVTQGVIKIHNRLVRMTGNDIKDFESLANGGTFTADDVRFVIKPKMNEGETRNGKRRWPAEAHFSLRNELNVGYLGWYSCKNL